MLHLFANPLQFCLGLAVHHTTRWFHNCHSQATSCRGPPLWRSVPHTVQGASINLAPRESISFVVYIYIYIYIHIYIYIFIETRGSVEVKGSCHFDIFVLQANAGVCRRFQCCQVYLAWKVFSLFLRTVKVSNRRKNCYNGIMFCVRKITWIHSWLHGLSLVQYQSALPKVPEWKQHGPPPIVNQHLSKRTLVSTSKGALILWAWGLLISKLLGAVYFRNNSNLGRDCVATPRSWKKKKLQ